MLLVHAHPDDETIGTGATMAYYAAQGVSVSLLTCTLGECGEILVPRLVGLEWTRGDQLGGYRISELDAALAALGVTDHQYLGGAGRFRDSGMIGTPANDGARALWRAASDPELFAEAVRLTTDVVRTVRPHVVVTYDPHGQYGHPDHILAHRLTTAAVEAAADPVLESGQPPWSVAKLYWTALSASALQAGLADPAAAASGFDIPAAATDVPGALADEEVTTVIDAPHQLPAKVAAMRAHATQITVRGGFYALSNNVGLPLTATEHFRLVRGMRSGPFDAQGRETDLFAGVAQ